MDFVELINAKHGAKKTQSEQRNGTARIEKE
jgi:hypothetical protein